MVEQQSAMVPTPPTIRGHNGRLGIVIGVWVLVIAGIQAYAWYAMLTPFEVAQQLLLICRTTWTGPLLFIGIAFFSPLLLVPAALMGGIAGICFGPVLGIVYTLIGCNLSAMLTYGMGRISRQEHGRLAALCQRYGTLIKHKPLLSMILLRLSFLPYDPINYLVGLLRIRVWPFLIGNTLGSLPGVVAIVLAGASMRGLEYGLPMINPIVLFGTACVLLVSVAVAYTVRMYTNRQAQQEQTQ